MFDSLQGVCTQYLHLLFCAVVFLMLEGLVPIGDLGALGRQATEVSPDRVTKEQSNVAVAMESLKPLDEKVAETLPEEVIQEHSGLEVTMEDSEALDELRTQALPIGATNPDKTVGMKTPKQMHHQNGSPKS